MEASRRCWAGSCQGLLSWCIHFPCLYCQPTTLIALIAGVALHFGSFGSMKDVLGDANDGTWNTSKAWEVINIENGQSLRSLDDINTVDVQAKDLTNIKRKFP